MPRPPSPRPQRDAVFDEFVRQCSRAEPFTSFASAVAAPVSVAEVEFLPPTAPPPAERLTAAEGGPKARRQLARVDPFGPFQGSGLKPLVVTLSQAAAMLTLSTGTVQRLVREGRIPKPRLLSPGRVGWLFADIERYVAGLPESDLLPPANTGWRLLRKRPHYEATAAPSPSQLSGAPSQPAQEPAVPTGRWQDARRDRNGQLAAAGAVYQVPGTDIVCVRRHRFGSLPMPFALVIHEGRYTWAQMELQGAARELALARLKALGQACSVMAADVIHKED